MTNSSKPAVVITGAAKGIGRVTASHLAQRGYQIFAGVRNDGDGAALMQESEGAIIPLLLDITRPAQIAAAVADVRTIVGESGLAGLVNNAGIAVAAPLEFLPIDELRAQLEVNAVGQLAVTQGFLPLLRQARGRIINISSMAGRIAGPWTGPYHASKFALEALTDALRQELAPWQMAVVSIEPGVIATPIWESSLARARRLKAQLPPAAHELYGEQMQRELARAEQNQTRGISPERVAAVVYRALTARRPRTRYPVGLDAQLAINLLARLPDRWRDWLVARRG